ncbi:hypothetical protein BN946_scf184798.g5 [Trametes cinnabarina]|uniref:Uncharacterized protein n=1 Tax=Pycnoporus cinnabarinus TaxID=5643 RepID=A0A060S8K7_PYCCI|nr:hypothetical protein BN946_scf184798.g5 [Trametes cinnabarina]
MGGPNLEVFKFGVYVFFPVVMLLHYGNPDWYAKNVLPYKEKIFPPEHRLVTKLPTDSTTLKEELAKIRARNLERKAQRDAEIAAGAASAEQRK